MARSSRAAPGEKINHALVLGGEQGIGKDAILEPLKIAVGPWNFAEISPQEALGNFNEFGQSVVLRISEGKDLGDVDRFAFYEATKTLIAAPPDTLRVNPKFVKPYYVLNVIGVIITTNHKVGGLFLPPDDRRHFVAWSTVEPSAFSPDLLGGILGEAQRGRRGSGRRSSQDARPRPLQPQGAAAAHAGVLRDGQRHALRGGERDGRHHRAPRKTQRAGHRPISSPEPTPSAATSFVAFLQDAKMAACRPSPRNCGYRRLSNPYDKRGRWLVGGERVGGVYVRKNLTDREGIAAAEAIRVDP